MSSATMQASACCLPAPGLPVPAASACPPLGLEQGARYGVLRWGERAGCGMGSSSWLWVKGAVLGTPLIPAAMDGTEGAGTRAGLDGQMRPARQRGAGGGSGCDAEAVFSPRALPLWRPWLPQVQEEPATRREEMDPVSLAFPAVFVPMPVRLGSLLAASRPTESPRSPLSHGCAVPTSPGASPRTPRSPWGRARLTPPGDTATTAPPREPERAACSQAGRAFLRGLVGCLGTSS